MRPAPARRPSSAVRPLASVARRPSLPVVTSRHKRLGVGLVETHMRLITAVPHRPALDARLVAAAVAVAIALVALTRVATLPRSADPALPNVTAAATARPVPTAEGAATAAPNVSPVPSAMPRQPDPTAAAPADRTGTGGPAPRQVPGFDGPNGPATVDQDGPRQGTDDPLPAKVILPKGSVGQ